MEKLDPAPSSPEGVVFYHFFMTYQLEHEQAEPTRVAGPFSASSSHREPVTEHQGPAREAEELRNRLREAGGRERSWCCSIVPDPKHFWHVPGPSHPIPPCGGCSVPQPGLGRALQEKEHSWKRRLCVGCPAATFGWDHPSRVLALELDQASQGWQTAPVPSWGGCAHVMHANVYANRACLWTQENTRTHQNKYGLPQPPFFQSPKE